MSDQMLHINVARTLVDWVQIGKILPGYIDIQGGIILPYKYILYGFRMDRYYEYGSGWNNQILIDGFQSGVHFHGFRMERTSTNGFKWTDQDMFFKDSDDSELMDKTE